MKVLALHPGVTAAEVQANTGFELLVAADLSVTDPPTEKRAGGVAPPRPRPPLHRLTSPSCPRKRASGRASDMPAGPGLPLARE